MDNIRRRFVDTSIGQIHLRMAGPENSPHLPLLCLHQSPKSSREFIPFMNELSGDRRVIAVDSPGHGESVIPPENPPVTIQDYAKIIWEALDALKIEKVDLFGNHTGAKVAVAMTDQQPERISHIIMLSALVLSPEEQSNFADMFQPVPLDIEGSRFKRIWDMICEYRPADMTLEDMSISFAENLRGGEAYEWGHRAAFAYNEFFPSTVSKLQHKISVLNPKDMLYEYTPRVSPFLQNGEIIDCPQWGHAALYTHPAGLAKMIEDLLNAP